MLYSVSDMSRYSTFLFLLAVMSLAGCAGRYRAPIMKDPFKVVVGAPDYSNTDSWAALPFKSDPADRVPATAGDHDRQQEAVADVFFIHPTSYLKHTQKSTGWNADALDPEVAVETDKGSILNQASVFNGAGRVFAPRYRQAFISAYFTSEKEKGEQALDLAYSDVKAAFEYYMSHYNQGRPVVIASHSQGTTHAIRLLQEYFDKTTPAAKLIAAYLVGMPVFDTLFTVLRPCDHPDETGCYVSWRTYAKGYFPKGYVKPVKDAVCTNPLLWTNGNEYAKRELNKGSVLWKFDEVLTGICDAQVADGVLRISEPRFRGRIFFNFKNYHIVDYNLFYMNVRQNARNRVQQFMKQANSDLKN